MLKSKAPQCWLAFALVWSPNSSIAEGQFIVPAGENVAHVVVCNNFDREAVLQRYVQEEVEVVTSLIPGECFSELLLNLSSLPDRPYYVLRTDSQISLIEGIQPEETKIGWDKLIYLFAGALLASMKGLFELIVQPMVSTVRLRFQLIGFRSRLLEDLNTPNLTIKFDEDLDEALSSSKSHPFITKGFLRRISDLKNIYLRLEDKTLTNVAAIQELGGKV